MDIETIPDLTCWTQGDPQYKIVPHFSSNSLERGVVAELIAPFPPPHAQRVVSISFVDIACDAARSPKYRFLRCETACQWGREEQFLDRHERSLLVWFGEFMGAFGSGDALVTWNGRTFDLPVIALRSLKQGVACPWYYAGRDVRYRYSDAGHLDLMDYLSDFGATRPMKLHDATRLVGLPGKLDMTGASVDGIYRKTISDPTCNAGELQAGVARYCLQDSIETALLFLRTRHHFGKVNAEEYNDCLKTFVDSTEINNTISLDWGRLFLSK
jgi:predicted PolB exonuclease-like 3'-5' exonuclease